MIDLRIRFDKIDGYIKVYDRTRYLVLFGSKKYDYINNRIRYLISVRKGITDLISHNYAKIKVDSYNSVPLEKTMTFHNVVILIKSVFDKDRNNYYYNIFLEKASNELPKNSFCIKYKCYIMIELTFLKELILTKQVHQKTVIFFTIGIF